MKNLLMLASILPLTAFATDFRFEESEYYKEAKKGTEMGHEFNGYAYMRLGNQDDTYVTVSYVAPEDSDITPTDYVKMMGFDTNGNLIYERAGEDSVAMQTPPTKQGLMGLCVSYFMFGIYKEDSLKGDYIDAINTHPFGDSLTGRRCLLLDKAAQKVDISDKEADIPLELITEFEAFAITHKDPLTMLFVAIGYFDKGEVELGNKWVNQAKQNKSALPSEFEKNMFQELVNTIEEASD